MIKQYKLLSEYNHLMNQRLYDSSSNLSDDQLHKDQGAFFKSVIGTLNHILVGDIIWLKRFASHPSSKLALSYLEKIEKPVSLDSMLYTDFDELRNEREKVDKIIIQWIACLSDNDIKDPISYKNMAGQCFSKSFSSLINHLFLHQVHHRGQATTLLSQLGIDFGHTDLIELISEETI